MSREEEAVTSCPFRPAAVFAAWLLELPGYALGFRRERRKGQILFFELPHVQDIGDNVWNYGPVTPFLKSPKGEWGPFLLEEKRGGRKYVCLELAYVLEERRRWGRFEFLLREILTAEEIKRTPPKLRREFVPYLGTGRAQATFALG